MPVQYSARAYNAYGSPLGWLRLVSGDAGRVVNGVAEAEIVAVGPFAAWWVDISYIDVWRYSRLGMLNRWDCYQVRGWSERYANLATVYAFQARSLTNVLAGRVATLSTTATATDTFASQAQSMVVSALGTYPLALPVAWMAFDGPQQATLIKATNQSALAGLQSLVSAAKALTPPVGPQEMFSFAVSPVIRAGGTLALGIATWSGEYGADRRVDSGQVPLTLWPKALVEKYEATRDERGIVTVVVLAAGSIANTVALDNPYGNTWAVSDTSAGSEATTNAYKTLWRARPMTELTLELAVDVDAMGLGLGDVVSVAYGGSYVDGRVNVLHATWNNQGEHISARVDIEV